MDHDVLIIFVKLIFFDELALKIVLHVLKPLPLQKYIQLIILYVHYVRAFTID